MITTIGGNRTIAHIAEQFDARPNQMTLWKAQLKGGVAHLFESGAGSAPVAPAVETHPPIPNFPITPTAHAVCNRSSSSRNLS